MSGTISSRQADALLRAARRQRRRLAPLGPRYNMALIYDGEVRAFWTLCGSDDNNAYVVVCPQTLESIIVDAPLDPGQLIADAEGTRVKAILITHRHRDHLEGLQDIVDATGALVGAHADDAAAMPIAPDFLLQHGETVTAGSIAMEVIHTPGHTPGSICLLAGRLLFTGDTLYAHAPGESRGFDATQQLITNIRERLLSLPDDTILLPGHGQSSSIAHAKALYRAQAAEYPDVLPPLP
jgi:glyoxylase-like metal-dependent hydrolase (beta-lactamase superfamily II)